MHFHVVTLFPEMIRQSLEIGIVGQAVRDGRVGLSTFNPREFTSDAHHSVDDRPFGGGDGMIMLAQTLADSVSALRERGAGSSAKVIHLSPRGIPLNDDLVRQLAHDLNDPSANHHGHLILIASRYGGVDQRLLNSEVDLEISVGDYILSGGEIPALVLMDALSRHSKGVVGNESSIELESFANGLLEHPQFTRPREWEGQAVPEALLSGHHEKIANWQAVVSFLVTLDRRPDLLAPLHREQIRVLGKPLERKFLEKARALLESMTVMELKNCGLRSHDHLSLALEEIIVATPETSLKKPRQARGPV